MKTTKAEVIFKTFSFFNSANSNSLLETKRTEHCFLIADCTRITSYDSPVIQTSCFCAIMLNCSQENSPKRDLQRDLFKVGLALQTEVGLQVFCLYMVKTLWTSLFFFHPKSLNQVHIPSQPCAYLHSALAHSPVVSSLKAPNCVCSCLELIHFTARMKNVTQMSAIHQMPFPHKSSRIKQKSD